jgi:hypothetical protein
MANRMIKSTTRRSSLQLADCLSSLFTLELATPSRSLYLFSPWISDTPLIDNRFGQIRALIPQLGRQWLHLSGLLNALAARGTAIHILCRPEYARTELFLQKLAASIQVKKVATLHEKGLMSASFYLRGSMNFTYSGIHINDEHVELTTEPDQVARALLAAQQRWETLGQ